MHVPFILVVASAAVTACAPDAAHTTIALPPPYSSLSAPAGQAIEPGTPIALDARQQEAVVTGVAKWMKDPGSVRFGDMRGARMKSGRIVACGQVNGRNSAGRYVGLSPFIGVLMAPDRPADFIVVEIAASERQRAEVTSLCRQSGVLKTG